MYLGRFVGALGVLALGCAGDASTLEERASGTGVGAGVGSNRPIVMVAGMLQDEQTFAPLTDALKAQGYDVTVYVPPSSGLDDIGLYAKQLAEVVGKVRREKEATQVDLIGHSEGGVTARRYVKDQLDGAPVHTLISLGSPQQGTDIGSLSTLLRLAGLQFWLPGLEQLISGSKFLNELNAGDATPGEVRYVTIGTELDMVTQPVAHAGIPGAENVIVQEACPGRDIGHFGLLDDGWALQVITSVLAGGPPRGDCSALPVGSEI